MRVGLLRKQMSVEFNPQHLTNWMCDSRYACNPSVLDVEVEDQDIFGEIALDRGSQKTRPTSQPKSRMTTWLLHSINECTG